MSARDDGGHAYPTPFASQNGLGELMIDFAPGMTLRDYFATHSEPSREDLVGAVGLRLEGDAVWRTDEPDTPIKSYRAWWSDLSSNKRRALIAKCKYDMADAMLEARKA